MTSKETLWSAASYQRELEGEGIELVSIGGEDRWLYQGAEADSICGGVW